MTAEHPLPWLAPITVMLLVFGIYPLALFRLAVAPQAQPGDAPARLRRHAASGSGALSRPAHLGRARRRRSSTRGIALVAAARAGHGDRPPPRHRPPGLWRAARADDPAARRAAGGDRHDVPPDGGRLRSACSTSTSTISASCRPPIRSSPIRGTALTGLLVADIWQWTPFMVLIMLAGLRALPKDPVRGGGDRRRHATRRCSSA